MLYATCEYSSRAPEPVAPPRLAKQHVLPDGTPNYVKLIKNSKVYDIVQETPLTPCLQLGERLGNQIWLKREDLQPVFSFKIRGAYNRIAFLDEDERKKGVATASAGNHAQGVALSANRLDIPCTIVMPLGTPRIKVDSVRRLGGENLEIVLHGVDFDEAKEECLRLVEAKGLTFIPPFDDPLVIAGQGTIGVEIINQTGGNLDGIFTPIGGGGMAAGVSVYVKQTADPKVKVLGVETYDADGMAQSLEKGERVLLSEVGLFSDGTAVRLVGEECFRLCKEFLDRPVVKVGTDEICAAIKDIFEETRSIAEPAGALALAGLKKYITQNNLIGANKRFVAVVSGANMNFDRLRFVAQRAELGEGREALLSVEIPERTGSFFALHEAILPHAITEFVYRFDKPDVAQVFVSINLTTADREKEVGEVLAQLESKAMKGLDISNDELAKTHVRYMVGGRASVPDERVFSFEFPERPGALREFLRGISSDWNISLFHHRNYGSDVGKILAGIQVPANTDEKFKEFLQSLRYPYVEETDNVVYQTYLRK